MGSELTYILEKERAAAHALERKPIWDHFGMNWHDYFHLPWPEKKRLIRKYQGVTPIQGFWRDARGFFSKWYWRLNPPTTRALLNIWFQENAERFTIKEKYPWAQF